MEISKMITLSTSHISRESKTRLNRNALDIAVYQKAGIHPKAGYGWFIAVSGVDDDTLSALPEDIRRCLMFARENGCDWLCFDGDAVPSDELPTYDW